jgi:putative ABC transport system permease protein
VLITGEGWRARGAGWRVPRDVLLLLTLGGLLAVAAAALAAGGVPGRWVPVRALARAALQLAVVAGLIGLAFRSAPVAAAFVLVMLSAVAVTAGRRLGRAPHHVGQVLLASVAGAAPVLVLVLGVGAFPRTPRYVISFAGIVLGATMSACTLSGRRLRERVADRWAEVEAWLALGAGDRQAVLPLVPSAVQETLLPGFDQTRTTGLVTLPGAFVGSLAGGASPLEAARFQLAVLAGLMAAQAVAAVVLLRLLAAELAVAPVDR